MNWTMIIVWGVLVIVTIVIEIITVDLVTIWFTVGALVALIVTLLGLSEIPQIIIFIVVSLVLLFATRPLTKRMMEKGLVRTNADRFIGKIAVVTKAISPNEIGQVKIEHTLWLAINYNNESFEVDEAVSVDAITGNKLVISKIQESDIEKL